MEHKNPKLPPQDLEAETSVLGALMLDKEAVIKIGDLLTPHDFYSPSHQKIYKTILELFEGGKPIDALTVQARLKEKSEFEGVGGASYLSDLIDSVPSSAHVVHYANIVREKRVRRDLLRASSEIGEKALDPENFEEILDQVEKRIFGISQFSQSQKFILIKDRLEESMERMHRLHEGEGVLRGVPTGFSKLDSILSGFQKSDLILLGARPSFGKTSLALDMARNAAHAGFSVGIFSIEMSIEQVMDRLIASEAQVPLWKMRTGRLRDETDFELIQHALGNLSELKIFVDDTPSPSILQMRSMARRLQIEHGLDLLVIDYLQLVKPRTDSSSMVQQVTEISRGLKSLAREMNVPVLALSQLSRGVDKREGDKTPRLSDLRESGCLVGNTLIQLADGRRMTIQTLAERKEHAPILIYALGDDLKLVPATITKVFKSGEKKTYKLTTKSGRTIEASANHKFVTLGGWKPLEELIPGEEIALPRIIKTGKNENSLQDEELILLAHLLGDGCILPKQPYHYTSASQKNLNHVKQAAQTLFGINARLVRQENWYHLYLTSPWRLSRKRKHPITDWWNGLGLERVRSYKKKTPDAVFACDNEKIALFLKHLWSTDGNLSWKRLYGRKPAGNIYYASTSKTLAEQVQHLLLRLRIQSTLCATKKKEYRLSYHVIIQGAANQLIFLEKVGIADEREDIIPEMREALFDITQNPNNDVIPKIAWNTWIKSAKEEANISWREFAKALEMSYCGNTLFKHGVSRERMMRVCVALAPKLEITESVATLKNLATSDVFWDKITSIENMGKKEVYDATVSELHNFVANDIIVHNSLEQDADVVMFLARKDRENYGSEKHDALSDEDQNLVRVVVAKHRNGPLGDVKLKFDAERVSFRSIDEHRSSHENF
ncbi:MAG: replicative DNA helicase [Patescibacteria group bacterium]